MKMRVLTITKQKKMQAIGNYIAQIAEAEKVPDKIPPAYDCDGERLTVIIAKDGKYNDEIARFCKALDKNKSRNVAFIMQGDPNTNGEKLLTEWIEFSGSNLIAEKTLYYKPGFFDSRITEAEMEELDNWFAEVRKLMK